jgi:hypothetical protein
MLYRLFFVATIVLIALLSPVTTIAQKVKYSSVEGTDFTKYKTYKWQRAERTRYPEPVIDQIFMRTIDEQLAAKGFTKTEGDTVDVYVIYQLAIGEDVAWNSFTSEIGWSGAYGAMPFAGATTNSTMIIRTGWMILDIYDVGQKKLVWQASATKTLKDNKDPKKIEKNARKVMAKIFKNYPYPK